MDGTYESRKVNKNGAQPTKKAENKKGFKNDLRGTDDLISTFDLNDYLVVDFGTEMTKVGFSGVDYPKIITPTVVGEPCNENENDLTATKLPHIFGNGALNIYGDKLGNTGATQADKSHDYALKYPVNRGYVADKDEDLFRKYSKHLFEQQIQMDANKMNVLIIDSPDHDKKYRSKIAEIFFDTLRVASINFLNSSVLSLFSTGLTEGLVIEMGHGRSSVVPVFGGYTLSHAMHSTPFGGLDSTDYLTKMLDQDQNAKELLESQKCHKGTLIKEIKEKLSVMADNFHEALECEDNSTIEERSFELPDGQILEVSHIFRHTSAEILFNPMIVDSKEPMLMDNVYDTLWRVDKDLRKI